MDTEESGWRQRAACWDVFLTVDFISPDPEDRIEAEKLCSSCTVSTACLSTVLRYPISARAGIAGLRDFGHPTAGKRRDARYGIPLGKCRHSVPTCESCWQKNMGLCRNCGGSWKTTGVLVQAETGRRARGRCADCLREIKRQEAARWRANRMAGV